MMLLLTTLIKSFHSSGHTELIGGPHKWKAVAVTAQLKRPTVPRAQEIYRISRRSAFQWFTRFLFETMLLASKIMIYRS